MSARSTGAYVRDAAAAALFYALFGAGVAWLFFFAVFAASSWSASLYRWDALWGALLFGCPQGAAIGVLMAALAGWKRFTRAHLIGLSSLVGAIVSPLVYAARFWRAWIDVIPIQLVVTGTLGAVFSVIATAIALKIKVLRPRAVSHGVPR